MLRALKTLVIGATGYVGSAVARRMQARGHLAHGLARNAQTRTLLEGAGVAPVEGDLVDLDRLRRLVADFDVVVLAAAVPRAAEAAVASAIVEGCRDSGGHFIFTSGTGVLSIESRDGRWNERSFAENDPIPFAQLENRALRIKAEDLVRDAAGGELHTTVIRPPLIYGHGGSNQVPRFFESARKTGEVCYLGFGLNLYSNVHVDDLAELYCLVIERGTPGALYHAVAGEVNFRSVAEAAATVVGCGTRSIDYQQACELWGEFWVANALAVNSRSTSPRARKELGWEPAHIDLISDIRDGSYKHRYCAEAE